MPAPRRSLARRQPPRGDEELVDDPAADQMFVNDALEHRRIAAPIPRAFGIDDRDRAAFADPEAVHFAAKDAALLRQAELLQASLQEFPRREPAILLAAFRIRLIAAQKDVAPRDGDADRFGHTLLRIGNHARRRTLPDPISSRARSAAPCSRPAPTRRRRRGWRDSLRRPRPCDSANCG